MLRAVWVDEAFKEVFNLLTVSHFDGSLDLLVEAKQTGEELGVVGRLANTQSMQQIEGPLACYS